MSTEARPPSSLAVASTRPILSRPAAWALVVAYVTLVFTVLWTTYQLDLDLKGARSDRCNILRAELSLATVFLVEYNGRQGELTPEEKALLDGANSAIGEACK